MVSPLWSVRTCEAGSASLLIWQGEAGNSDRSPQAAPYRCHSWRCKVCGWAVAREDFRRVEAAAHSRDRWLYGVLTFDPRDFAGDRDAAFIEAGRLWDKRLRRAIERQFDRLDYVQTWERHPRTGWPHVNLLFRSDALLKHVDALGLERRPVPHGRRPRFSLFTRWRRDFRAAAMRSGFGRMVWLEVVQDRRGMAHYLAKVAQEFTGSAAKDGDQRPFQAPPHFRRLRASRGLLPPRQRIVWEKHVDQRTGEETWALAERSVDKPSEWSGVLSPIALSTFTLREPSWHDVAEAWAYQAMAARARQRRKARTCTA